MTYNTTLAEHWAVTYRSSKKKKHCTP